MKPTELEVMSQLKTKGYNHVVQFEENDKPFGEPLAFKNVSDISEFMKTYPNMKQIWYRSINDHITILQRRHHA